MGLTEVIYRGNFVNGKVFSYRGVACEGEDD